MHCSGFTILSRAQEFDYPYLEAIQSILPICDEFIVNVNRRDRETRARLAALRSPKIAVFEQEWDESLREGGRLLSQQTNLALARCRGRWAFYVQADEVVHEQDLPTIAKFMEAEGTRDEIDGLRFRYLHFYGQYNVIQDHPKKWYQAATRLIKTNRGIRSWGDAQDFRKIEDEGGRRRDVPLRTADIGVQMYHYGWCRDPQKMLVKQRQLDRYYRNDPVWLEERYRRIAAPEDIYDDIGNLAYFHGTHPAVMASRVAACHWRWDPKINQQPPRFWRMLRIKLFYKFQLKVQDFRRFLLGRVRRLARGEA